MTEPAKDRLFAALPYVYRLRDAEIGHPLRTLLRVIEEQVDVLERDLDHLYDNAFIETCDDAMIPYIGELVGWQPGARAGAPGEVQGAEGMLLRQTLAPRADVARTFAHRRRKGTLPLLEELARVVAGWPAHAAEFYRRLAYTQPINHPHLDRGQTIDVREADALACLGGAFDATAHTVEVRRPSSGHGRGRHGITGVGVFVWRLRAWPVTYCQAYLHENTGGQTGHFTFDILGADNPLFVRPEPESDVYSIARPEHVPARLTRHLLARDLARHYGEGRSLCIYISPDGSSAPTAVPVEQVMVADLTEWAYAIPKDRTVLIDPELGRFKARIRRSAREPIAGTRVSFQRGFAAAIGGGEYQRERLTPAQAHTVYVVGSGPGQHPTLAAALTRWRADAAVLPPDHGPRRSVIEVAARGAQSGPVQIDLAADETLILRASDRQQTVLRLHDHEPAGDDTLAVVGHAGSRFVLDGFLVTGRGISVDGAIDEVEIRHCTLQPPPRADHAQPSGPPASLQIAASIGRVRIDRCILGPVVVTHAGEPTPLEIVGSIVDASDDDDDAIGDGEAGRHARATLTIRTSTILGRVTTHALALAENSIFSGAVHVARRQPGCMRFCYVPPGSRTPRRFRCQPDGVLEAAHGESPARRNIEVDRVRPVWTSRRHGDPAYAQLWRDVAREIARGAEDEGEMGVFHDLYWPQREDALAARLAEYIPAGFDAGIFFET